MFLVHPPFAMSYIHVTPPFPPMHGSIHMSNIVRSDDVGHCKLHLGVWVCWKPPSEFRSEPWWDPGGKGPRTSKKSAMYSAQQGPKDHTRGSNSLRTSSRTE